MQIGLVRAGSVNLVIGVELGVTSQEPHDQTTTQDEVEEGTTPAFKASQ